jgi:hypothetical protein
VTTAPSLRALLPAVVGIGVTALTRAVAEDG